jgi:hypothetical protein
MIIIKIEFDSYGATDSIDIDFNEQEYQIKIVINRMNKKILQEFYGIKKNNISSYFSI